MIDADDMPVFVPQHLLDQVAEQTLAERGRETGGILIGNLHRDATLPEIFAEVTAQIPAEHTRGDAVKLTFTPDTWVAVDNAIKLRGRSEIYLGYWHSHPVSSGASQGNARWKNRRTANWPRTSSAPMMKRCCVPCFPAATVSRWSPMIPHSPHSPSAGLAGEKDLSSLAATTLWEINMQRRTVDSELPA